MILFAQCRWRSLECARTAGFDWRGRPLSRCVFMTNTVFYEVIPI